MLLVSPIGKKHNEEYSMKMKPWNAALMVLISLAMWANCAYAVADKTNQGRWEKPTENNLPDKEVPGFLVNLGPTGARAILTEKTFIVKYIFKNSPAVGKLNLDDEITGVFGKPFSTHHFKGEGKSQHGYEGPIMDFGEAIERAEGSKDGLLVLNVSRGSAMVEVKINLEPLGTFSPTFPFNCKKSEIVRARALNYFMQHPESRAVWQSHARAAVALALMSSDEPAQQMAGKDMVMKWNKQSPDGGTWTWNLSHQLITLSEYNLLTHDPSVLPMMKTVSNYLEHAQYGGKIVVWKAKDNEDPAKIDASQQLYEGGFGHAPYVSGIGKNGYGPMQYTTCLAVIGWELASRCGVEPGSDFIKRSLGFIHRGTNAAGYVAYGGEFTLNNGYVDPVAWKKSKSGDNYVGRSGCALIAHKLSPEFPESAEYLPKYDAYLKHAYKSMPDGHADSNLGIIWGLMGAATSEDPAAVRALFDYHKAFFNMMRCFDGSFVLLPGRDYADSGYYMASRYHPTATMALAFGLAHPKLMIQGVKGAKGKAPASVSSGSSESSGSDTAAISSPKENAARGATAKEAAAKPPAAKPVASNVKVLPITREAFEAWHVRFIKKLDTMAKAGAKIRLPVPNGDDYFVAGADEKALSVIIQGNTLPMPWKQLSIEARATLAKEASKDGDAEALIIAAVYQLATDDASEAEDLFAKASLKDADAVKAARTEIFGKP